MLWTLWAFGRETIFKWTVLLKTSLPNENVSARASKEKRRWFEQKVNAPDDSIFLGNVILWMLVLEKQLSPTDWSCESSENSTLFKL